MTSSSAHRRTSPSGGITKPLKRGKACLTCRFLKIRCDGARPVCGPCQRTPKDDPCEYADGPGRSRTRALEETVSRLEARLREYEHPDETPPVALHNPYDEGQDSDTTVRVNVPGFSSHSTSPSPYPMTSPSASILSPHPGGSSGSSDRTASSSPAVEQRALPATSSLLEWFFKHSSCFGFFLDISRFSQSALLPYDFGHQSRPCPGLLSTVYLWGIHLSPQAHHKDLEHTLLMRALRDTASDLSSSSPHPHRFLHTVQAETLLGYYFFRNGNILEAKRHAASAASLALGCGLNTTRSTQDNSALIPAFPDGSNGLPASQDTVEEGERVNAFWAVFTLYRDIAVAMDPSGSVCGMFDAPGCQIHTPWPLDIETYRKNILPHRGVSTVYNFLNHVQQREDEHQLNSTTALITKASILLHQAVFVAGQYRPDMPAREAQTFLGAFQSLKHLIDGLRVRLPPLDKVDRRTSIIRELLLAHALVQGSIIRLNEIFSETDPSCRHSCVSAAQALLHGGGLNLAEFGCVNPIMGTLWALACQTLVQEVGRLRSVQGSWSSPHTPTSQSIPNSPNSPFPSKQEEELLASLRQGISALTFFSSNSALMSKFFASSLSDMRYLLRDRCMTYLDVQPKVEDIHGTGSPEGDQNWYNSAWGSGQSTFNRDSNAAFDTSCGDSPGSDWSVSTHAHAFVPKTETYGTPPPSSGFNKVEYHSYAPSCGREAFHVDFHEHLALTLGPVHTGPYVAVS
ncbi:hypothetical protein D9757_007485 [Collybiopsis confluens]|uniref:Zn(2)-C6 fungal-type domain-containing protein n=1 Tax=Collybiopsis confluens TaxID=2823264 RepID=A0A8H5HJU4_9AGAR|nr:hypothetical protein D9757_007485 [Collybiopsis confluens]